MWTRFMWLWGGTSGGLLPVLTSQEGRNSLLSKYKPVGHYVSSGFELLDPSVDARPQL
jgi:hypothetical protein